MSRIEAVSPAGWRRACERALADGRRFAGLYALEDGARALFADARDVLVLRTTGSALDTIVDLVPAAAWDEREAHDLYDVRFAGHEPMRALVDHPDDLDAWTTPVRGHDPYQVAVGPIHAGVIESGHFRFHVVGERIVLVDLRLFYKHRGLERAAERASLDAGLRYVQRACAACAVANAVAYAHACERALGLRPDPALAATRTVLLELERLYNHLNDIGAICAGIGFAPGSMAFAQLKERAQRLNLRLAGHRFLFDAVAVGSTSLELAPVDAGVARENLAALRRDARRAWREVQFNASVQARLDDVGTLTARDASRLGAVGPAARASGLALDARTESPRLAYAGFRPAAPRTPTGDVAARLELRAIELDAALSLLDELLAARLAPGVAVPIDDGAPIGVGRVESPRGETVCAVETDGRTVRRVHLRTGSYANWAPLAHAAAGEMLPDFPLINKSFELCYACADR